MKTNLVPCNTCSKEIAKSAKACPHCGAPTHEQKTVKAIAVLIIAALAMWATKMAIDNTYR